MATFSAFISSTDSVPNGSGIGESKSSALLPFPAFTIGEEVIPPTGYYATTNYTGPLSHTMAAQAGHAFRVKPGNYWTDDVAGRRTAYENWSEGRMEWKIPIGWVRMLDQNGNPRNVASPDYEQCGNANSRPLLIGGRTDAYKQIFTISQFGTAKIEKHRHWLSRSILCVITLDGDIIQWSH